MEGRILWGLSRTGMMRELGSYWCPDSHSLGKTRAVALVQQRMATWNLPCLHCAHYYNVNLVKMKLASLWQGTVLSSAAHRKERLLFTPLAKVELVSGAQDILERADVLPERLSFFSHSTAGDEAGSNEAIMASLIAWTQALAS